MPLRTAIIHLASTEPKLRKSLLHLLKQAEALENPEEEAKPKGKGKASGKFVEFMKEMGDKKFTNPKTHNVVKLKSLSKSEEGKKIVQDEFKKWLSHQEEKEKSTSKAPEKKAQDEDFDAPYIEGLQALDAFEQQIEPLRSKWSDVARLAARRYTDKWYTRINAFLRGTKTRKEIMWDYGDSDKDLEENDKAIAELDKLFKTPEGKIPQNVKVIRGLSGTHNPLIHLLNQPQEEIDQMIANGLIVEDKGYISTSIDEQRARDWGETTIYIDVPKGTEAIYVGKDEKYSKYPTEMEVILNRGTKVRIKKVDRTTRTIYAQVVPR